NAVDEMQWIEEGLLRHRKKESERYYYVAVVSGLGTGLFGIIMMAFVSRIVRKNALTQQRAAEAIAEERERFRVALKSIGDAVIVTDHEGRVTFMNDLAQSLTGAGDAAIGQPLMDVVNVVDELTGDPVGDLFDQALTGSSGARSGIDTLLVYGPAGP